MGTPDTLVRPGNSNEPHLFDMTDVGSWIQLPIVQYESQRCELLRQVYSLDFLREWSLVSRD